MEKTGSNDLSASSSALAHIAKPYASALYDLAGEANTLAEVEASLVSVSDLINQSEDFAGFLQSPVISADEKIVAIDAIVAKADLPETTSNFIRLVAQNGRLFALPAMFSAFADLAAAERDELRADVVSASPLSKKQLSTLSATLKKKLGKSVTLDTSVDSTLIGGLVVKVGSQMIDTSLKTKLAAMQIAMKEVR